MVQTPVTDGSFEDVSSSALNVDDATSGGWTLSGPDAYFLENGTSGYRVGSSYETPYGSIFVALTGYGNINSVSQPVALSACRSGTYTLSYSYNIPYLDTGSDVDYCTFRVTYGGATIDSVELALLQGWTTRTKVFTPATGGGALSFIWDCTTLDSQEIMVFLLDNISVS
jgi:hypothetical protein